ncbi:MAG: UvrD-helicase domain-containing protein [Calditrichaeota bacterium]|nr:UvrD-helicase domain-containing protein [Calditrichota bacterium]
MDDFSVSKIIEGLNPEQQAAVTFGEGPLLVVAGAGTGKTRVITHRIAYLIASKRARPEEILALTFTDKAAAEMQARVDELVPYGYATVAISTFHAFGDRILREYALEMGLTSDLKVLSRPEQVLFFRDHIFDFPLNYFRPLGDPTKFVDAMITLFSRAKDEDVSPEDYLQFARKLEENARAHPDDEALQSEAVKQKELAECYKYYQDQLTREGKIDFGDQVSLVLSLFRNRPAVLGQVQSQFKYILVDEFQDTNYAQFQLLRQLAKNRPNITVVGDDDQSIYKFRGAAISNILNFTDAFPTAQQIVLTRNYRSTQAILDAAYAWIVHNNPDRLEVKSAINKQLVAETRRDLPPVVRHLHFDRLSSEADAVAEIIQEQVEQGKRRYSDFAILVRANNDADPFLTSLRMAGIPAQFSGSRGLYKQHEIQLLLAFLRVLYDFADSKSLSLLAESEIYQMPVQDQKRCYHVASRNNRSLFDVFQHYKQYPELEALSVEGRATLEKMVTDINAYLKMARENSTGVVLYEFLTQSGYLKRLTQQSSLESDLKIQNIAKFFEIVKSFGDVAQVDRVSYFVEYLDLLIEAGDDPATADVDLEADAVHVLTVHKAKGLEFPVVFLVSLVEQKFPHRNRREPIPLPEALVKEILPSGDFHLQEERRLFYVGMTRAQEELYLTSARDYGGKRLRKVSQFVAEALDRPIQNDVYTRTSAEEAIQRFAPSPDGLRAELDPIPDDQLLTLSFYQIDDYLTCPLKYKYVHILRVPIAPHHTVIYGSALHQAISEYYRRKIKGFPVDFSVLENAFRESWSSEGFFSREHEEQRFEAGLQALKRFFEKEEASGEIPLYVEKEFSFNLGNNHIVGRWDRVDKRSSGIVIVDFKSSDIREQKKADDRAKKSLQLAIYVLAYESMFRERPVRVELRFLESGLTGSVDVEKMKMDKFLDDIQTAAHGIRQRDFEARPDYMSCRYCSFNSICPSVQS